MSIANSIIVVIQNEPRDGDIINAMESEEAFNERLVEWGRVPPDETDFEWSLGWTYNNVDDFCSITGHEVQLPYLVNNICGDCFWQGEQDAVHEEGSHLVVNFTDKPNCEVCKDTPPATR